MIKMIHPNRKGQVKKIKPEDVEQAKLDGWTLLDAPKPKKAKKTAKRA